ncbi:MAG: hypothetical protein LUH11_03715 [Candidatus Gastranaerophilales bacterium]|nr:hypothetical protein [Candidatus Gastranaerophilales bacterium]
MSVDTKSTKTLGVFIPEFWSKKLNKKLDDVGVMKDCVNKAYEGEIKQCGDKVNIMEVGDITINDHDSATALTYQTLTASDLSLIVDQEKYFAFKVNDVTKVQANQPLTDKYIARAAFAIEMIKDTFLLSKRADVDADNVVADMTLTKDNVYQLFVELKKRLRTANAISQKGKDTSGRRPWAVVNPDVEALILLSPEMKDRGSALVDKTIREGTVYDFCGFDVMVATNMKTVDGVVEVIAGIEDAITFAGQISKIEHLRSQDGFDDLIRGLYVYGGKTLLPKGLAKCACTVSA